MSRPLRLQFPGSLWHVTHRGNERRLIFYDDADREQFLKLLGEAVLRFAWILTAYVLMPNHFHLVVEVTEPDSLSRGMAWFDGKYVSWINRRHKRVGHLYQGRFKALMVEKETYFLDLQRYVVLNPVRAKMVVRPEHYAWSCYRAMIGEVASLPWLATDDVLAHFSGDRRVARGLYREFVNDGIGSDRCPWDDVVGAMYLGSEEWRSAVRERVESWPRSHEHARAQRELVRPAMSEILSAVASVMRISEERIRCGRGGMPRMVAAWIGFYEGLATNLEIAASLRLRSDGHVTKLVRECERELRTNVPLRECVDRCLATLGRKNRESKT